MKPRNLLNLNGTFFTGAAIGVAIGALFLAFCSGCAVQAASNPNPEESSAAESQAVTVSCATRIYVFEADTWATWETSLTGVTFTSTVTPEGVAYAPGASAVCSGDCALTLSIPGSSLSYAVALSSDRTEISLIQPYAGLRVGYTDTARCESK